MKVVILGKGLMLANIILGAKDAGAEISGVFRYEYTCENPLKMFFKNTFNPEPEETLIKSLNLKELKFKSANSDKFRDFLIKENIDLIIVGTWRERLKKEVFEVPKLASVNLHPSFLPKYRGPNPYMQTILHGEKYTGVTIHLIDENYDTGGILLQERVPILDSDTSKELRKRCTTTARGLVREFISNLDSQIIPPTPQNENLATYYPSISGDERMLDFTAQTSVEITRTIRALHPFLPCYITYKNKFFITNPYKIKIIKSNSNAAPGTILEAEPNQKSLTIQCKDYKAVKFEQLKLYRCGLFTRFYISKIKNSLK